MAKHSCLKANIRGYELSISIDDNLCDRFRYEIRVFKYPDKMEGVFPDENGRNPIAMAEDIIKLTEQIKQLEEEGKFPAFDCCITQ